MADFFTHFSCVLDVGSARNAVRAMTIYLDLLAEYQIDDAGGNTVCRLGRTCPWSRQAVDSGR